ncbi:MAG: cation:proton antiporter regulatory subunit [Chloroflexi bacterium]|nr:cation:proton antiporter regulatory subunit [Chloroflexota bacterium]
MHPVEETELAGIGKRYQVTTSAGSQLVIIVHESGMVELYYCAEEEPQEVCPVATLTDDEARLVAAIIGRTLYRPEAIERLSKHGLTIRWHSVKAHSYAVGKTVRELFENTGIAVMAVVEKDGKKRASPPGNYVIHEGSQLALSGATREIDKLKEMMDQPMPAMG